MKKITNLNRWKKIGTWIDKNQVKIIMVLIFLFMFILNVLTPYIADDISYSYIWGTNQRISSVFDIFASQYKHYMSWGGRTVAHFIAQLFLMFPKMIFNIANSLCYMGIVYKISMISNKGKTNAWILILIHLLLLFLTPFFGEDFIWLIGSCNYSWTLFIMLCFIDNYRKDSLKNSYKSKIGMLLLGILAGWTNENTGFALVIMIALILLNQKVLKKKNIEGWKIFGLIGSIIGYIILLAAPGNYLRSNAFVDDTPFMIRYFHRFVDITKNALYYLWPILLAFLIVYTYYAYKKKKPVITNYIFLIGSFISAYAMMASPSFPERAWVGIVVFLIISFMMILIPIINDERLFRFVLYDIIIILSVLTVKNYYRVSVLLIRYDRVIAERKEYIKKNPNQDTYYFQIYDGYDKYSPIQGKDITKDKENWLNKSQSKYLNVPSIEGYY